MKLRRLQPQRVGDDAQARGIQHRLAAVPLAQRHLVADRIALDDAITAYELGKDPTKAVKITLDIA